MYYFEGVNGMYSSDVLVDHLLKIFKFQLSTVQDKCLSPMWTKLLKSEMLLEITENFFVCAIDLMQKWPQQFIFKSPSPALFLNKILRLLYFKQG